MKEKSIYHFGQLRCDGSALLDSILGGKGAGLAEMCRAGVRVPPGFTIVTSVCDHYHKGGKLPPKILEQLPEALGLLGEEVGLKFGSTTDPLLVSVRSGSVRSMPGMLDTILNVGLNDETVGVLGRKQGDRFAYDSYRRFIQMYATTVLQIDNYLFEEVLEEKRKELSLSPGESIVNLSALQEIVREFKEVIYNHGYDLPQSVHEQLYSSIGAVFKSWMNSRAVAYRNIHGIPSQPGTAVNVQAMVFGNLNCNSATGVVFTRNPSTGEREVFGEFLVNAQGEDVVSGNKDPSPISAMRTTMPLAYDELVRVCNKLELHYRDMQDIEFTVQNGTLWILQTRSGKRSPQAGINLAVNMVREGLISKKEAISRIDHSAFSKLLHPVLDGKFDNVVICKGLPASPGAASGCVAFTPSDAELLKKQGREVVLVRQETSPEDVSGMYNSAGIVTLRGGMTSHAAVVARGMGKPCVCGVSGLFIDKSGKFFYSENGLRVSKGDNITINGSTGEIMLGIVKTVTPELPESFYDLMRWADEIRVVGVMANADNPEDMKVAMRFGADGVGLCRTEHMFFSDNRIMAVQEMIVASNKQERERALKQIGAMQKEDFKSMFSCMPNKQITIRLLDPPLHEFLPNSDAVLQNIATRMGKSVEHVKNRVANLAEKNPMLGHRGCRLAVSYPEIYEMQLQAIFEAVKDLQDCGIPGVVPEIMIPFVVDEREVELVNDLVRGVSAKFSSVRYIVGAMIELPRAALIADKLAKHVQFFSFGTNDLTQTTMGMSRDDSSKFMEHYISMGVFCSDPFELLDMQGVGRLIKIAATLVKDSPYRVKMGICGEHGSTPEAMSLCHELGLNYVSCSPYKVPVAKLLAAKYAIADREVTSKSKVAPAVLHKN